ncbi:MAG TPA: hypothetical protein VF316_24055 [Polyangiaceae bacterium]
MTEDGKQDVILDTLWERALQAWEDDKVHAALLEFALRREKLPDLAGRYRSVKDDADKGPIAKKRLDGIVLAATHLMLANKTPKPTKNPPWLTASALLVALLLLGGLTYAMWFYGTRH